MKLLSWLSEWFIYKLLIRIFGEYHSNSETGDGYADITFCDAYSEKAVIIEIKSTKSVSELIALSEEAVLQIEEKHYADHYLKNLMVQSIYAYGIAFQERTASSLVRR